MIPRKANIFWFGNKEMPAKESYCLSQNKKVLKDYEFKIWNENDFQDLVRDKPNLEKFISYALSNKIYAQLSDLAKLLVLEKEGGWCFDTDNEFVTAPDNYLKHGWVSGFENYHGRYMPITAVMAAQPSHKFTKFLISAYEQLDPLQICHIPNTEWISNMLFANNILNNNMHQYHEGLDLTLYPSSVFCATGTDVNPVAFHHFSGLWIPNNEEVKRKL